MDCRKCESGKVMEVHGIRWCALQGLEIIQVEVLSNKLLTTAFEASLGCMAVTSYDKFFEYLTPMLSLPLQTINSLLLNWLIKLWI